MYSAGIGVEKCALLAGLALLALLAVPAAADEFDFAQTGPKPGFDWDDCTFYDVKSEELYEGGWFGITWAIHAKWPGIPNTAGVLFSLHYDGHEVSSLNVCPGEPLLMPGGPVYLQGSESGVQSEFPLSVWGPDATSSGVWLPHSELISFLWVSGYAKNTTPCNNSDVDIDLDVWRIHHVEFSGPHLFGQSAYFYLTGTTLGATWATQVGTGFWVHYTSGDWTWAPQSAFVATQCLVENVAGYGVEHMPEPLSVLLMLFGIGSLLTGPLRRK